MVAMALVAAGVQAIGSLFGGIGKRNAAKARAKAMAFQAQNVRREAGIKASLQMEESDRVGARAATLAASSGGGGLQGSALGVIDDLARQGMYRARQVVRDGQSESWALLNDAATVKRQGDLELFSSFIDATSTVLGQMGRDAEIRRSQGL